MDRLSELLGQTVQFVYTCWDRIVLTGYIERLQRPENLLQAGREEHTYAPARQQSVAWVDPFCCSSRVAQRRTYRRRRVAGQPRHKMPCAEGRRRTIRPMPLDTLMQYAQFVAARQEAIEFTDAYRQTATDDPRRAALWARVVRQTEAARLLLESWLQSGKIIERTSSSGVSLRRQ